VTVLFSDVTGSTTLGERLDPESMRRVLGRYFERSRVVLEHHGGTVEKFIGDAVMAVFGVPQLHEDDALRAVRAAVDLRRELQALNVALERELGLQLETRTGINTGEVVAGAGQTLVTGDAVNVAARLEQVAEPGAILIGDATHRLVKDAVTAELLDPLSLKGKSGGVRAWRLDSVLEDVPGLARRLDARLVGRERELERLLAAYREAVAGSSCQLFTVLGPAGIGKSRLGQAFAESVQRDALVLHGHCLPYGEGITYWPLGEIVRSLGGEAALGQALEDAEDGALIGTRIRSAVGLSAAPAGNHETFWAIRRLFEELARERPLVVVLDDLHWAEPTFLDLVEYLATFTVSAAVVILCLARADLLDLRPTWSAPRPAAGCLTLTPLSDTEAAELVEVLAGAGQSNGDAARVIEAAEGNPLFLEQLLAMLEEDGGEARTLPPTIHALLAARLDRLEPDERSVLERAAVEGRVFHRGAVGELSADDVRPELAHHLMTLVRKELVGPDRATFVGEDAFRFLHILIRDAAYGGMSKALRAELHERFAGWLERSARGSLEEHEEILGYHLEQASLLRGELGLADGRVHELARMAAERLGAAGRRALARGDDAGAGKLLSRAVELLPARDPLRVELLPRLGQTLFLTAEFERAETVLREAVEHAEATGATAIAADACLGLLTLRIVTDPGTDLDEAWGELQGLIDVLERAGDDVGLARAALLADLIHHHRCQARERERAIERGLLHARRAGAVRVEAGLLARLAETLWLGPTPVAEAMRRCEEIVAQSDEMPAARATALHCLGALSAMAGQFDHARRLSAESRALWRQLGLKIAHAISALPRGVIERLAGDRGAAESAFRAGYAELEEMGETAALSSFAWYLADLLIERGALEEAEQLSRVGEQLAQAGDVDAQVGWRCTRARLLARRGESEAALGLAAEALARARGTDFSQLVGAALQASGDVLEACGRRAEASAHFAEAAAVYETKGDIVSAAAVRERVSAATGSRPARDPPPRAS